jgi:hypothetical protein
VLSKVSHRAGVTLHKRSANRTLVNDFGFPLPVEDRATTTACRKNRDLWRTTNSGITDAVFGEKVQVAENILLSVPGNAGCAKKGGVLVGYRNPFQAELAADLFIKSDESFLEEEPRISSRFNCCGRGFPHVEFTTDHMGLARPEEPSPEGRSRRLDLDGYGRVHIPGDGLDLTWRG